jgi:hypothetical protein
MHQTKRKQGKGLLTLSFALLTTLLWVTSGQSAPTGRVFLPLTIQGTPYEPALTIYDLQGAEQDWPWLIETFGDVSLDRGAGAASVSILQAMEGPTALVVWIFDAEGGPLQDVEVVYHWPGAPLLDPDQMACGLSHGLVLLTKAQGNADFPMGGGSYYFPPAGGPHTVWVVSAGTDCLRGLGMLGGTNHIHLDSTWVLPSTKGGSK